MVYTHPHRRGGSDGPLKWVSHWECGWDYLTLSSLESDLIVERLNSLNMLTLYIRLANGTQHCVQSLPEKVKDRVWDVTGIPPPDQSLRVSNTDAFYPTSLVHGDIIHVTNPIPSRDQCKDYLRSAVWNLRTNAARVLLDLYGNETQWRGGRGSYDSKHFGDDGSPIRRLFIERGFTQISTLLYRSTPWPGNIDEKWIEDLFGCFSSVKRKGRANIEPVPRFDGYLNLRCIEMILMCGGESLLDEETLELKITSGPESAYPLNPFMKRYEAWLQVYQALIESGLGAGTDFSSEISGKLGRSAIILSTGASS